MLSGEEYAYYDDGYNYSGIRMDDVEYVEDADGNVVLIRNIMELMNQVEAMMRH